MRGLAKGSERLEKRNLCLRQGGETAEGSSCPAKHVLADVFESVDSGAEADDSQTACECVSPRDTDDFGRRLLHVSLPASERLVTSARLPLVFH